MAISKPPELSSSVSLYLKEK